MSNDNADNADNANDEGNVDNAAQGFSEEWLTLREPADHAARNNHLSKTLADWSKQHDTLSIVELGAGTGSNLRYLMPMLGPDQHWVLVDNDATLLDRLPDILQPWVKKQGAQLTVSDNQLQIDHQNYRATVQTRLLNLAIELDKLPLENADLLTASALLDLTSAAWLDQLAELTEKHQCSCLFALNYNGKICWQPELDSDNTITTLLNQHQLKDKGFGNALGPEAGMYFGGALQQLGRHVETDASDWVIEAQSQALQHAIVDGWAPAAMDQDSGHSELIGHWHGKRRELIQQAQSSLTVGHVDLLSLI